MKIECIFGGKMLEASFRQPRTMYHGSTSEFLHTILKLGVVPDPSKKRWDTDDQESQSSFSRASLSGSYWASNLMSAMSAAGNVVKKFGGHQIIVIANIAEQSAYADEDSINAPLMWAVSDTMAEIHSGTRRDFWTALGHDLFESGADKRANVQRIFTKLLHDHLKGGEKHVPDQQFFNELLDTLVLRSIAYEVKNGLKLEWWLTSPQDLHLPPISDLETKLLKMRDRLTRSYRSTAYQKNAGTFSHTLRIPTVVGFRGANRITSIIEIKDWYWVDGKLIIDPMILAYGSANLPDDFMNQYRERVGKFPGLVDQSGRLLIASERQPDEI